MSIATIVIALHGLGLLGLLVGGIGALVSRARVMRLILVWAARVQLVTGVILAVLAATSDEGANWPKLGVKLVIALAVAGLAEVGNKRGKRMFFAAALALTVLNAAVAFGW